MKGRTSTQHCRWHELNVGHVRVSSVPKTTKHDRVEPSYAVKSSSERQEVVLSLVGVMMQILFPVNFTAVIAVLPPIWKTKIDAGRRETFLISFFFSLTMHAIMWR